MCIFLVLLPRRSFRRAVEEVAGSTLAQGRVGSTWARGAAGGSTRTPGVVGSTRARGAAGSKRARGAADDSLRGAAGSTRAPEVAAGSTNEVGVGGSTRVAVAGSEQTVACSTVAVAGSAAWAAADLRKAMKRAAAGQQKRMMEAAVRSACQAWSWKLAKGSAPPIVAS